MAAISISQFLTLYTWFPLAMLTLLLLLIGRFFERTSGERTYYQFFGMPVALFGISAMRYASLDGIHGDLLADALLGFAGLSLAAHCLFLLYRMTRNR